MKIGRAVYTFRKHSPMNELDRIGLAVTQISWNVRDGVNNVEVS
jgi:hypothetical protein